MNETSSENQEAAILNQETSLCLLTYTKRVDVQQRLHQYADYLCHLLHGHIRQIKLAQPKAADAYLFGQDPAEKPCDLIVFGEPDRSLVKRFLARYDKPQMVNHLTTSMLVAREPRHPIKKILLIFRAAESDQTAVAWACRLAKNRDIKISCLPIVPSQPGMYRLGKTIQPQEKIILAEGSATLNILQRFMGQFRQAGIQFEIKLQEGEPLDQIEQAIAAEDHDLVIIAEEPYGRLQRFFLGEIITPLLHALDRPILITTGAYKVE